MRTALGDCCVLASGQPPASVVFSHDIQRCPLRIGGQRDAVVIGVHLPHLDYGDVSAQELYMADLVPRPLQLLVVQIAFAANRSMNSSTSSARCVHSMVETTALIASSSVVVASASAIGQGCQLNLT